MKIFLPDANISTSPKAVRLYITINPQHLLQPGLGSHCRRALAPAPAPELSSTHSLAPAPAPALQLFNKQVVYHLVFKSFLR